MQRARSTGAVRTVYKSARYRRERSAMWREGSNGSGPSNVSESPLTKLFDRYLHHLDANPLVTKALTSMVIVGVGDVGCQLVTAEENVKFDFKRFAIFTFLGGALVGPALHYWYGFLGRLVPGVGTVVALKRLAVDQTIFAASFIPIFMTSSLALEGRFNDIVPSISREWFPALLANWALWIPANFINFRFLAPKFQVLFANVVALAWNGYLSLASHRDEPSGEKKNVANDWDNERVGDLFHEFDRDGNGRIDSHEFQDLAFSLGLVLDETEAALVINTIDQDGDGMIDLREFQTWLHGDEGQKDSTDAVSLQALLLAARLRTRVALRDLKKSVTSEPSSEKKKEKIIQVTDLKNVSTQGLRAEIETRLRRSE